MILFVVRWPLWSHDLIFVKCKVWILTIKCTTSDLHLICIILSMEFAQTWSHKSRWSRSLEFQLFDSLKYSLFFLIKADPLSELQQWETENILMIKEAHNYYHVEVFYWWNNWITEISTAFQHKCFHVWKDMIYLYNQCFCKLPNLHVTFTLIHSQQKKLLAKP